MGFCYNKRMERIAGFPPILASRCRTLILGSMPSLVSLEEAFYYAHGRNAFWPILSEVFGTPCDTVEQKRACIVENDLALWDVLQGCERRGSLDASIRAPQANDFSELFSAHPEIRKILFNGATAWRLFERFAGGFLEGRRAVRMPSTSPANTMTYAEKLALWRRELKL